MVVEAVYSHEKDSPERLHKQKDPTSWFKGPTQGDSRNHALQGPCVYVFFWAPILGILKHAFGPPLAVLGHPIPQHP